MNARGKQGALLILLLFISSAAYALDGDWSRLLDKNGIQVYVRSFPNSALREYRAEVALDEAISSVAAVLDDIPAAVEWFPYCRSASLITELPDGRKIMLNVAEFPWPFQDRYSVFSSRKVVDYSRKEIAIDFAADDAANAQQVAGMVNTADMIRLPFIKGEWALQMVDRHKTRVIYTICADAGGNIPVWLIKTFFESTPYQTLESLRRFVKKKKYQESRMSDKDRQGFGLF